MPDSFPQLRNLSVQWTQWEGRPMISLQDPLRLGANAILVPQVMAPILPLCDGTRSLNDLRNAFSLRTGIDLNAGQVESLIQALDEASMLDNQHFRQALDKAMEVYRSGPYRPLALAGNGYPQDAVELGEIMDDYLQKSECGDRGGDALENVLSAGQVVGLISPHIDYRRGWRTYAHIWSQMAPVVQKAELVMILGTDHSGYPGSINLTRQSYGTPWGGLPTDTVLVDRLAEILGKDRAFSQESHHIGEHSIELASVWLHYVNGGEPKTVLPVLCGGPQPFLEAATGQSVQAWQAVELLKDVAASKSTLVVAAADISHIGPTFGDPAPIDAAGKSRVHASDEQWLDAACSGNSDNLRNHMLEYGDPTRICGAAPIFLMTYILGKAQGRVVHYDQCPADDDFGSLVSIAGAVYIR